MPFAIKASFLHGFYQGRDSSGETEDLPTPLRLYSALVAGAYSLNRQESNAPEVILSDEDRNLLEWLEQNPPDGIYQPRSVASDGRCVVYRNRGEVFKGKDKGKTAVFAYRRTFLAEAMSWYWLSSPGQQALIRLGQVLAEVPYLGDRESPVVLWIGEVDEIPTGALRKTKPSFNALTIEVPAPGRLNELDEAYKTDMCPVKKEQRRSGEVEHIRLSPQKAVIGEYYEEPPRHVASRVPWGRGFVVKMSPGMTPDDMYSEVATCLHRALARQMGDSLPSIMAHSRSRAAKLANGLAIQVVRDVTLIDESVYPSMGDAGCSACADLIVVMMPLGTPPREEVVVARALSRITHLYSRRLGKVRVAFEDKVIDLSAFWKPVSQGFRRLFVTDPLFIPDTRPPSKSLNGGVPWTVEDDAIVSLGYAWKDCLGLEGRGDRGRIEMAEQLKKLGVIATGGRIVPTRTVSSYYHKANQGSSVLGEKVVLDVSSLDSDTALVAIGQSRHFSGGLLVPLDIPVDAGAGQK